MDVLLFAVVFLGLRVVFCFWTVSGSTFLNNSSFSHMSPNVGGAPWLLRLYQPFFVCNYFLAFIFYASCEHWYMLITCPVLDASSSAASSSSPASLGWHCILLTMFSAQLHTKSATRFHSEQSLSVIVFMEWGKLLVHAQFRVEHWVGALCSFSQEVIVARWHASFLLSTRSDACKCVDRSLFQLRHLCCQVLDKMDKDFNVTCFLVLTLARRSLGLPARISRVLCWFIILDGSNHVQVFLNSDFLITVF